MKFIVKSLFGVGVHLMIFTLVNQCTGQSLIQWQDYLRDVAQRFVIILQEREITGNGMPLREFDATIDDGLYDIKVNGTAKFHSGFIAKIDGCGILSTSYKSTVLEAYSNTVCFLTFDGVQTVYDVEYDYEEYKGRGTVLTWYKQLQFDMEIRRNHTTNEVTSQISLTNPGNQNDYVVKVHPNNGYTQLTAKEIKRSSTFRAPITDSFRDWTETWRDELRTAVSEHKFPDICYYCP